MQTILGSGGAIGYELAKVLPQYTDKVRLVARNPQAVVGEEELVAADLLNAEQVMHAVAGSEIVYLTVGLPYNKKVWARDWPVVINNTLAACAEHKAKLVFFDNVYMYDPKELNPATEDSTQNPVSQKGKVRKQIAQAVLLASRRGEVEALIARSADFYGPGIAQTSMLNETVIKPLAFGNSANWMGDMDRKHSFTYTPDAAKGTALLGNTPDAYGQVWHLPTADNPPTGRQWIGMVAKALGTKPKGRSVSKTIVRLLGIFVPVMRELVEMIYQYEHDYVFQSNKFEARFKQKPTPYEVGILEVMAHDYPEKSRQAKEKK
jgi:nucleoside-diphosphate-sugar epimerase